MSAMPRFSTIAAVPHPPTVRFSWRPAAFSQTARLFSVEADRGSAAWRAGTSRLPSLNILGVAAVREAGYGPGRVKIAWEARTGG